MTITDHIDSRIRLSYVNPDFHRAEYVVEGLMVAYTPAASEGTYVIVLADPLLEEGEEDSEYRAIPAEWITRVEQA